MPLVSIRISQGRTTEQNRMLVQFVTEALGNYMKKQKRDFGL